MLASVEDPRDPRGMRHRLEFVLAVAMVATLAGARNYAEIARKAADMPQGLLEKLGSKWDWFKLRYQWPSWSVIRNVLSGIAGNEMDRKAGQWLFAHARKDESGEWSLALDGKVMRGSWTAENDKFTLFSAMIHREAITVAQVSVPAGTNETTQAAALLEAVDTIGIPPGETVLITMDAAHTCRETASEIKKRPGFDYLMNVKGNRPKLQRAVFDKLLPVLRQAPHHVIREHARGQIRKWSCWVTGADGIRFPCASQLAFIRRDVFEVSGQRVSKQIALMITSREAGKMTAADFSQETRNHWGIENKSHYPRDTTYREDHTQAWAGEGPRPSPSCITSP